MDSILDNYILFMKNNTIRFYEIGSTNVETGEMLVETNF